MITVLFYFVVVTFTIGIVKPDILENNVIEIIKSLFPPLEGKYWYITCYVFVFFMIPYMNRLLHSLNEKEYFVFISLSAVLLSVIPTVGIADYFRTSRGYSPWWLLYCYIMGGYIKRTRLPEKYKKKSFCWMLFLNILVVFILWNFVLLVIGNYSIGEGVGIRIIDYVSPFTVVSSVCTVCVRKST